MSASNYSLHAVLLLATFTPQILVADDGKTGGQEPPACKYCPEDDGWSGWLEVGFGHQNEHDYRLGRYSGIVDSGAFFDASGEGRYRNLDGGFFDIRSDHLGLDSRRLRLRGGEQGSYEIGFEYHELPNYRERDTYSPLIDLGNGRLGLPVDWVAGNTSNSMPGLADALARTDLYSERQRTSVDFTLHPRRGWEISGYAKVEKKEGVSDLGTTFSFGPTVILPLPFKYETDEFGLSLGYVGTRFQSRLSYTASLFKNDQDAIQWRNPYQGESSNTAWGQMADYPDNQFHQISAILGYQLRADTRIGVRLARGLMTQDENLLPYSVNPSITSEGLPRTHVDARVDTTLAALEFNMRPSSRLRLDASYTYSDRDNKTPVDTYSYVTSDLYVRGTRTNRPYSFEQNLLRIKGAYRLPGHATVSAGYNDDRNNRSYTEIEKTKETTAWAKLALRPLDTLEASLKYSYSQRDGSPYVPLLSVYPQASNNNSPFMRVIQLADRNRSKPGLTLAYTPTPSLSLGLDVDYAKDDYASAFLGLQEATAQTYTANANYSFNEGLTGFFYYTYDKLSSAQKGSSNPTAPTADNLWIMADRNLTETVGLGINWEVMEDKLELGADLTYADYRGNMLFGEAEALPQIESALTAASLRGSYRLSAQLTLRAQLRYERYEETDWVKDGSVAALPTLLSLGAAPQDSRNYLGFLSLRYEF